MRKTSIIAPFILMLFMLNPQIDISIPKTVAYPIEYKSKVSSSECDTNFIGNDDRPRLLPDDEKEARRAFETLLAYVNLNSSSQNIWFRLSEIWGTNDWAIGELAVFDISGKIVPSEGDVLIGWKGANGVWNAAKKGTVDFNRVLSIIPNSYLPYEAKQLLYSLESLTPLEESSGLYKLPF
mgnify:CR=1 FL=1